MTADAGTGDAAGAAGSARPSAPYPGRILAVDYGERRIGLAVSDPSGTIATPAGFIERRAGKRPPIAEIVRRAESARGDRGFVIGTAARRAGRRHAARDRDARDCGRARETHGSSRRARRRALHHGGRAARRCARWAARRAGERAMSTRSRPRFSSNMRFALRASLVGRAPRRCCLAVAARRCSARASSSVRGAPVKVTIPPGREPSHGGRESLHHAGLVAFARDSFASTRWRRATIATSRRAPIRCESGESWSQLIDGASRRQGARAHS